MDPNGGFFHWGTKASSANPGERPLDFHQAPPLPIPPRIRLRSEDSGVGALFVPTSAEECPRIPSNMADPSICVLMYPQRTCIKKKFGIKLKPKRYQIPFSFIFFQGFSTFKFPKDFEVSFPFSQSALEKNVDTSQQQIYPSSHIITLQPGFSEIRSVAMLAAGN